MNEFINELKSDVKDVHVTDFDFFNSEDVPSVEDNRLTYANGKKKVGQTIETCVLFVDIRNSVALNNKHQMKTMGKIYTTFTRGVLKSAQYFDGMVRNIIGDRVMIVFPHKNCFINSVSCAVTINHLSKLIREEFSQVDFHVGIGIDYGLMHVIKVGVIRKGEENVENKNLVWIGTPANFASRLTDQAGKEIKDNKYVVKKLKYFYHTLFSSRPSGWYPVAEKIDASSVADIVSDNNEMRTVQSIQKLEEKYTYPTILVSESVFEGYKKENPGCNSLSEGWWKKQEEGIRDVDFNVYGADLFWRLNNKT